MPALAYHLVLRLEDDRLIAPTAVERRVVVQCVYEITGSAGLLVFALVDTHLHILMLCDRREAGQRQRRLKVSLRRRLALPVRFASRPPKAIETGWYVYNSADYILRQFERHGLQSDLLCEGSNLPDLLGMRVLAPEVCERVARYLPRLSKPVLWDILCWPTPAVSNGPPEGIREATLAATARPRLAGRTSAARAARRAAMELIGFDMSAADLARALEVNRRTLPRARRLQPDPALVRAIGLQLGARRFLDHEGGRQIILARRDTQSKRHRR